MSNSVQDRLDLPATATTREVIEALLERIEKLEAAND
jgi:hypothetical protein